MNELNHTLKIGLIGGVGSGKTMLLLAMDKYAPLLRDSLGIWIFGGLDSDSITWLDEKRKDFADKYRFPVATIGETPLKFGVARGTTRVCIETQDREGGDYETGIKPEMIESLSKCDAFVFLITPHPKKKTATRTSDLIRNLLNRISEKRDNQFPLPQRVSVCLTQYDDDDFFHWLQKKAMLEKRKMAGVEDTPFLPGLKVIEAIRTWNEFSDGDGQAILDLFAGYFPGKVNFFAISSIGFWREPDSWCIKWGNCSNVSDTPDGPRVRMGHNYTPVNLFAPLGWIISDQLFEWELHPENAEPPR